MPIDQATRDRICELIADGNSLRSICKDNPDLPSKATVMKELTIDAPFQDQYARAREQQADHLFDEIQQIADDGRNDTYFDDSGNRMTNHDVVARSKLRVDARKWMAGKLRPKVYGDKVQLGGDPENPLVFERIVREIVEPKK